jgi:hypothetical protein
MTNVPQDVMENTHKPDLIEKLSGLARSIEVCEGWRPTCIDEAIAQLRAQRQQGAEPVPIYQYTENELGGGFVQWNDCKESTMKAMAEKGIRTRIVYTTPPQADAGAALREVEAKAVKRILNLVYEQAHIFKDKTKWVAGYNQACADIAESINSVLGEGGK